MHRFTKLVTGLVAVTLACALTDVGAAFAQETPQSSGSITREGNTVYANGVPIVIKKDVDNKTYVYDATGTTKLDETPFAGTPTVYGGGKGAPVEGDTSITVEGATVSTIYGGGWNAPVSGSVHIIVNNARTSTLYGGGYSDGTGDASIGRNVTIELTGTGTKSGVHGGGYAVATKGDAVADVAGSVTLTCDDFDHQAGSSISGGGYASASGSSSAHASVGSVNLTGAGRTYVVRAGGTATASAEGAACANVLGAVTLTLSNVDAREIYGGGYASGAQAQATVGSVSTDVQGDEVMILQGGGQGSNGGTADVTGAITTTLSDCSNLYGYVCGGGVAYTGSSSKAASASLSLVNCGIPVAEQWGNLVSAAIYGGGVANGQGSNADIAGSVSLSVAGGDVAGSLYGGGEATGGGSASAGSVTASFSNMQGALYEDGSTYVPSVFLAGEADADSSATFGAYEASATIENSPIEHVWSAVAGGQPLEVAGASSVTLRGTTTLATLACIDAIDIESPLHIGAYMQNANDVPTMITARGIATNDPAVICDDADLQGSWFALRDGDLSYAVEEGKSVWRIAKRRMPVEVNVADPAAPQTTVDLDEEELKSLFTEEERAAFDTGTPVSFSLEVKPVEPSTLDASAQAAIEGALDDGNLGVAQYLDISFFKRVGDQEVPIKEAGVPVKLVFAIPEELLAPEGEEERTFFVVRVHERADGTIHTDILPDLDNVRETMTILNDRFSAYALAYEKAAAVEPEKPIVPEKPETEKPGQTEPPQESEPPKQTEPPASDDQKTPKHDVEVVEKKPEAKPLPADATLAATGDNPLGVLVAGGAACTAALVLVAAHRRRLPS